MDTEDLELKPYEPVPDTLVLAAVERAERHTGRAVPHKAVAAHLGFRSTSATTRRLRPRLEAWRRSTPAGRASTRSATPSLRFT